MKYVADIAAGELSADIINRCIDAYFEYCAMQLEAGITCKIPSVGAIVLMHKRAHNRHNVNTRITSLVQESTFATIKMSNYCKYFFTESRHKVYADKARGINADAVKYVSAITGHKAALIKIACQDWGNAAVMSLAAGQSVMCSGVGKLRVVTGHADVNGRWALRWIALDVDPVLQVMLPAVAKKSKKRK